MANCMLTTSDNPYNPYTHFNQWFVFDQLHDYKSCELLGREVRLSDQLSLSEIENENERAINEIILTCPTFVKDVVRMKVYPPAV